MTPLQQKLDLLFRMVAGRAGQPPAPEEVVIAELSQDGFDPLGRPVIAAAALRTVEEYDERFSALMVKGFAWINLNFYGLLDGRALVTVEFPEDEPVEPGATSVNFSGPPQAVSASSWDARPHLVLR